MALSQADLLDLWRRLFPESYTQPFEDEAGGRSLDLIAAIASVFERVAAAVEVTTQAMYVFPHSSQVQPPAAGAVAATGTVEVTRAAPTPGTIPLLDGDRLSTYVDDASGEAIVEIGLEVDGDQTLAAGSLVPVNVSVRAARAGHHGNVVPSRGRSVSFLRRTTATVTGATTTAANVVTPGAASPDRFNEGMVDAFVRFTAGANVISVPRRVTAYDSATGAITVDGAALVAAVGTEALEVVDVETMGVTAELVAALTNGTSPWLDLIGGERNRGRNAFETDTTYRTRIRELPDVVAPNSIYRAASRILTPLGVAWELKETRGHEGADAYPYDGIFWDDAPWDDPAADVRTEHTVLGDRMDRQGFIVLVQKANYGDFGICWDHPPVPGGVHPFAAWDWGAWDGWPEGFWADLRRLIREVEDARMAGVPWLLCLVDSLP